VTQGLRSVRARGEDVRRFILENVSENPKEIAALASEKFQVTRQAVGKHLLRLTREGSLIPSGNTRRRTYKLAPLCEWSRIYEITEGLAEDQVWSKDISLILGLLPENVLDIWRYCFTEMFNNAMDHSDGTSIYCQIRKTAVDTQILLADNGIGIFKKIQTAMGLLDERHAILELAKGKLTTDPSKHSGQGIFFTSRVLDSFDILSGGVFFTHTFGKKEDWILERSIFESGTMIFMKLGNHTARTCKKIFDQYSTDDDFGFTKTVVPVKLAQFGNDKLISRSQAKRVLSRVDLFKTVVFDFDGLEMIGQAFADEIFRVFALSHPQITVLAINMKPDLNKTVAAAIAEKIISQQRQMALD